MVSIKNIALLTILMVSNLLSQNSDKIKVNQLGYITNGPKEAVIVSPQSLTFYITSEVTAETLYTGALGSERIWSYSNETVRIADFSSFKSEGKYFLVSPPSYKSHSFEIKKNPFYAPGKASLKGYYYQRASTALTIPFAYVWFRQAGHLDTAVIIHASAASDNRPENSKISSPKGWYDAGDYNKYIVNSGISMFTLLSAYETFPEYYDTLNLNIPESINQLPDILDEVKWNLDWMLTMQDPEDGGVYHKLTNANFDGYVMPHNANTPRYVVQKSTAATLNFAAVTAQASRIFAKFNNLYPGYSIQLLEASKKAWGWAKENSDIYYNQTLINMLTDPDINTGEYGDSNVNDEFNWAACELYITTKADSFIASRINYLPIQLNIPSWQSVNTLGFISLSVNKNNLTSIIDTAIIVSRILTLANSLVSNQTNSAYRVAMGQSNNDFVWGSNSVAANQGVILLNAYLLRNDIKYYNAALANADYLLGRNGTGYSFLTGYGSKRAMKPHHRVSQADGLTEPVPGLLVGGPNPGQQDNCAGYPSNLPALSYLDDVCSYASNEIAINWNAPAVYLFLGLEAVSPYKLTNNSESYLEPNKFQLYQNYPNPFNPETNIQWELGTGGHVSLIIYDLLGNEVTRLVDENKPAGSYNVKFSTSSTKSTALTSGVYFYRLQVDNNVTVRKMILLR
ncbi:MAG: glycoside hydrolase family 9 protein [Ignavibacteria bacterium]|nr:glycoside hydrolase family 9 protein [Ignavibacteria bacterium]